MSNQSPSPGHPDGAQFPRVFQQELPVASVRSVSGVVTDIGDIQITARAEAIRHNTDEAMIWQESPSLALLFAPFLRYLILVIVVFLASGWLRQEMAGMIEARAAEAIAKSVAPTRHQGHLKKTIANEGTPPAVTPEQLDKVLAGLPWAVTLLIAMRLLYLFVRLKTTKYAASSQRLIIEHGILSTVNVPFELHRLGNAVITKPLFLRPFGVTNMTIPNPGITLVGLRNSAYVRDILRRSGEIEASRIDKVRFR